MVMKQACVQKRGEEINYVGVLQQVLLKNNFKEDIWPKKNFREGLVTSVQVIFVVDTVVSYYCIYYEYYLNRPYVSSLKNKLQWDG